ncbi:MAG: hypothetical protein E3J87_02755 [Candidatus Cloacimonadota bacterium]|nr:MAG: hypothetical protein E3J87_02755 [Candidatus Cloacimonadota bacterium]
MTNLLRIESEGYPSYVTTKTKKNIAYFKNSRHAETVISAIYFCHKKEWMYLLSFVVMPEHSHIIIIPRDKDSSQIMHSIKSYTANKINEFLKRKGNLWQQSFWEYTIPNRKILLQKVQYVHNNPVRKGLCNTPEEYPFSSANPRYETDLELFF